MEFKKIKKYLEKEGYSFDIKNPQVVLINNSKKYFEFLKEWIKIQRLNNYLFSVKFTIIISDSIFVFVHKGSLKELKKIHIKYIESIDIKKGSQSFFDMMYMTKTISNEVKYIETESLVSLGNYFTNKETFNFLIKNNLIYEKNNLA